MVVRTVPEPVSTFIPVPAGVYTAAIAKIESEWKDADQFHDVAYEQLAVTWELDADEIDDDQEREGAVTLRSWFAPSMNEKSNLVKKLLPALGVKPAAPLEEWDEQDWIGLACQIQVERFVNTSGVERNKIVGYLAIPKKKGRRVAEPAPITRAGRPEPNGPEEQRKKLIAAAAEKDVILPGDQTAAEWADILDVQFEMLDSDFRVERGPGGTVTAAKLHNAILALPDATVPF